MPDRRHALGRRGEDVAAAYLTSSGFTVLDRNFATREGEVDLVALDGSDLVFVEVKTRRTLHCGIGEESLTYFKRRKLWLTAARYLDAHPRPGGFRFDLVVVDCTGPQMEVRHHRNVIGPGGSRS